MMKQITNKSTEDLLISEVSPEGVETRTHILGAHDTVCFIPARGHEIFIKVKNGKLIKPADGVTVILTEYA